ncbi:transmembrane protein, putative [Bodo saltans]|uniref:Transmembrane protein, putative n=1 Tax=Bodo saltans TaxID=75058 RepID=A0A0S4J327_BODSA|nr:transmembrane protein, putative [Bodo saltans]|eukprot:CUG06543.1 transmembrane protein, putative [Bodo saltans]
MTEDFTGTPRSISAADSAKKKKVHLVALSNHRADLTSIGTRSLTPSDRPSQTVSRSMTFSLSRPSPTSEPSLTKSVTESKGNLSHTRRTSPTILSDSITGSGDTNTRSASPSEERSPTVRSHSPTPTSSYRENSKSFSDHASSTTTATVSTTVTGALSVSETITSTEGSPSMTTTNSELLETYTWSTTSSIRDTPSESKADPTKTVSSEVTKSKSSSDIFIEVFHMEITLEVATTAAAAASLGIVLIGGMAPTARSDASAQALLMQIAPCISRDRDLTVDEMMTNRDNVGGRSVYGLSPFWDFGLLIAAYANIAVFVVFFWLYGGVVLVMGERAYHAEVAAAVSQSYGTKTAIDVDDEQEAAKLRRKGIFREWSRTTVEVASRLRFPSIPLRVVEVLLPGTTFCAVGYLLTAPSNTSGLPAGAVIAVVGTILLGFVGYLHVRIVPCLKYTAVHHPLLIPDAVSPYRSRLWIARLIPTHRWEPHILRPSFGTLYDSMNERYVRYRTLDIGLVLSYSGMSALSTFGTGLSCIIGCGWMTLSMVIAALMTATHEMYRLPLDRVLVPFKHIIFAIICSLKTAGVEVPSWLYYVQFGVLLIRVAYGFWVKHEENRIVAIEAAVAQQPTSLDVRAEEWGSLVSSDDDEVGAGDARSTLAMFDLAAEAPRRDKSDIRSTASRRSAMMQTPPDAAVSVAILPPYWPPPTLPRAEFEREEHAAIWEVL